MRPSGTTNIPHFQFDDDHYPQQHPRKESNNTTTTKTTIATLKPSSSSPALSSLGNNTTATCLKMNKDSRVIKKSLPPSSSSPALLNNVASLMSSNNNKIQPQPQPQPQQQRHPVIIYTHSPTIIKTNTKDFISLVQKLTGISGGTEDDHQQSGSSSSSFSSVHPTLPPLQRPKSEFNNFDDNNNNNKNGGGDFETIINDNETAYISTDEIKDNINIGGDGLTDLPVISSSLYIPSMYDHPQNLCFGNSNNNNNSIPFFNPNSAELLCTSQPLYNNYSDPSSFYMPPPSIRTCYSASSLDAMKDLPDF